MAEYLNIFILTAQSCEIPCKIYWFQKLDETAYSKKLGAVGVFLPNWEDTQSRVRQKEFEKRKDILLFGLSLLAHTLLDIC